MEQDSARLQHSPEPPSHQLPAGLRNCHVGQPVSRATRATARCLAQSKPPRSTALGVGLPRAVSQLEQLGFVHGDLGVRNMRVVDKSNQLKLFSSGSAILSLAPRPSKRRRQTPLDLAICLHVLHIRLLPSHSSTSFTRLHFLHMHPLPPVRGRPFRRRPFSSRDRGHLAVIEHPADDTNSRRTTLHSAVPRVSNKCLSSHGDYR